MAIRFLHLSNVYYKTKNPVELVNDTVVNTKP